MDRELWKEVVDYEGLYQVSNLGRVAKKYNCPATLIARRKYQFRKRGLLNG